MNKITYTPTTLDVLTQGSPSDLSNYSNSSNPSSALDDGGCLSGIISKTSDGFRFEEVIRKGRPPRNLKLFDGQYVSMVRMRNGRYQLHLKTMGDDFNKETFAFNVYSEICSALKITD